LIAGGNGKGKESGGCGGKGDVPETDDVLKGVVDHLAKHRNGPIHSGIGLIFRRELAKFENASKAS